MRVNIEISERDLRYLVINHLNAKLSGLGVSDIYVPTIEVRTTYGSKENWKPARYIRVLFEKEIGCI